MYGELIYTMRIASEAARRHKARGFGDRWEYRDRRFHVETEIDGTVVRVEMTVGKRKYYSITDGPEVPLTQD